MQMPDKGDTGLFIGRLIAEAIADIQPDGVASRAMIPDRNIRAMQQEGEISEDIGLHAHAPTKLHRLRPPQMNLLRAVKNRAP
ncbi:hypothetical protein LZ189_27990, partial [Rhodovulum sulfidophilum]|nr:hypothetical protein [Rhodovulum sulfidophilum]